MPTARVPRDGGVGVALDAYSAQAGDAARAEERRGGQRGEARAAHPDEDDAVVRRCREPLERTVGDVVGVERAREPLRRRQHVGEEELGIHASSFCSTRRGA